MVGLEAAVCAAVQLNRTTVTGVSVCAFYRDTNRVSRCSDVDVEGDTDLGVFPLTTTPNQRAQKGGQVTVNIFRKASMCVIFILPRNKSDK